MRIWGMLCVMVWALVGCGKQPPSAFQRWANETGKIRVLSTTGMIDDLVRRVGGERVAHLPLITREIDPHSYELVKGDDEKFSLAAVVFCNGLGLEHGASLRYQLETHPHVVSLGGDIAIRFPERILWVDHEMDPHIWMDIALFSEGVEAVVQGLVAVDPEGKSTYEKNGRALYEEMQHTHNQVRKQLASVPKEKRYLVTSHDAFNYFAKAYLATDEERKNNAWQERFVAPEGLAPDGQLSAADIRHVVDHLIQYRISVVFPESNVSQDSLKKIVQVARQKKLNVHLFRLPLYGDAMGTETYLEMMEYDVDTISRAWKEES